jgi:hypothetical protein
MDMKEEYKNIPPKDIQNAIWGACFDYNDFDDKVLNETVRDRIYDCWNRMHHIIKSHPEWFIDYVTQNEPDRL